MNHQQNLNMVKDLSLTLLAEGKTIRIRAHGYSMYPCIKPGSLVIIEPLNVKGPPVAGEIIAVKRERGIIVHRLAKVISKDGKTQYIARGDSNPFADNPVGLDMIAGRVTGAEITGVNTVKADIRINTHPRYFLNRLRVIILMLRKKIMPALF